ncbi:MAG: queuosine salvage family protein [Candidatus Moraniibacteriota bacterium]
MTKKVILNQKQCELIGKIMLPLQFRKKHFERPFLTFIADSETKLRVYLFATAICHQTHTLANKRKNLEGWDCLEDVFTELGRTNSSLLDPEFLAKLSSEELVEKLEVTFSDDGNPKSCNLDRLGERADFIIQIAKVLNEKYEGKVEKLINKGDGYLLKGEDGLYNLLEDFDAYSDPLRKKSTVFIQMVVDANLYKFKDLDSVLPVMDYHMQRLLLRTGCVEVVDDELKTALQNKKQIESDDEVRRASIEATKIISKSANKNYFDLNFILWSIGRSCCKEKVLCQDGVCNKNPCTFFETVDMTEHTHCIFERVCMGNKDKEFRKYWQPIVETHYY